MTHLSGMMKCECNYNGYDEGTIPCPPELPHWHWGSLMTQETLKYPRMIGTNN